MPEPTRIRLAPAKVNLALAVGPPIPPGRPGAGYHPVWSWMHAIDLYDEVSARALSTDEPSRIAVAWAPDAPRRTPIDWPIAKDLAARAHGALEAEVGRPLPVELAVRKRIPVGSGLGGGSSDAAATLLVLNDALGLRLGVDRLTAIGHGLGSDVPFFIDEADPPRPAIVSGLGERVDRTARGAGDLWLVIPPFGCGTGAVYAAFDRLIGRPSSEIVGAEAAPARAEAAARAARLGHGEIFNDLTGAAEMVEPRLADVRARAAAAAGRPVQMTGSGSALFVIGPGIESIGERLARALPEATLVRTRLV